jgi:hypothetical protein
MLASEDVDGIAALLPGRVQKATVDRGGALVLELYVHPRPGDGGPRGPGAPGAPAGEGVKRWLVVADGGLAAQEARPPRAEAGEPPAAQGLVRKELVPSTMTGVRAELEGALLRLDFARPDGKGRVLLIERTADPRTVLGAATEEGLRVLLALGGPPGGPSRPVDGRDLRRGRIYEPPRAPPPAARADGAAQRPRPPLPAAPAVPPALAGAREGLRAESRRLRRLVDALTADLARHGEAERHAAAGELLKSALARVRRGMRAVEVVDWDGTPRTIALDPLLDGAGNLEALFKRARRAREAARRATPRLEEARARLAAVDEARARLLTAEPASAALEQAALLLARPEAGGSARRKAGRAGRRQPWRSFRAAHDVVVRVGRGARDNDALVKSARGNDLWLHARGHQGAHVIVPSSGADVDPVVLLDAAHLAAHFSSARGERHVDVQTARVKHLRKPGPGAPAGLVHVTNETVVHLRLEEERLRRLLEAEVPA